MTLKFYLLILALVAIFLTPSEADRPVHCMEPHPKGYGLCRMALMGYYFNPATSTCEKWMEGGCGVEGGYTYHTLDDCKKDCVDSA